MSLNKMGCQIISDLCWKQNCYGLERGTSETEQRKTGWSCLWSFNQGWQIDHRGNGASGGG